MARLTLLHSNDLHGQLTDARMPFLLEQRETADLYFDSGDVIKAGNLAIPLSADPAWPRLAAARCTASTLGNRESHLLPSAFEAKIAGAAHPLLVANMRQKDGQPGPWRESIILEVQGLSIGVFGVMVAMVTERMASRAASSYLWDQPIPIATRVAKELRADVDMVIALTHIGVTQDRLLAEACPEIDLILGGHSHTVLGTPERIGNTWIAQGGSHGRFLGRYEWALGEGLVASALLLWNS